MDAEPIRVGSPCPIEAVEDMRVFAVPSHIQCSVGHAEQVSECQACSPHLQPRSDVDVTSRDLFIQPGHGGILLDIMGSVQNLGLLYMAISAFNLAMMGMFVKLAGKAGMSTWEIVFARSVIVSTSCLFQLARSRTKPWGNRLVMLNMRGVLGMCSVMTLFFAMRYLPIADAIVFTFLAPVIILVASPYVLGEDTGNQWLPVLLATTGVLLICQPSFLFGHGRLSYVGVMFGLMHACISAAAKMLIRALKEEPTEVKMLYLATYCIVVSGLAMVIDGRQWTPPNTEQALLLVGCGVSGFGVQFFMTMSLECVEASLGMGMTYTAIIWSELVGIFLFREIPNAWAVVGTVVVLYSTVHSGFVQVMTSNAPTPMSPRSPFSDIDQSVLLQKAEP